MKTEIARRFKTGFFVNETELARLKDAINDQFKKINSGKDAEFSFEVKYANGGVTYPKSLSDITCEENDGSKRVVRLLIKAKIPELEGTLAGVKFCDFDFQDHNFDAPISYYVVSDDQDWTFVTSSTIEERVNKVKTKRIYKFLSDKRLYRFVPLAFILFLMTYYASTLVAVGDSRIEKIRDIKRSSATMWDYMYRVDTLPLNEIESMIYPMLFLVPAIFLSMFMDSLVRPVLRWFPVYTFYWGDRVKAYDLKINLVKFLFGAVFLAVCIGLLVNYIYDAVR